MATTMITADKATRGKRVTIGKSKVKRKQDCGRVHQDGERGPGAKSPICEARSDIDPRW